jgi:hypothetical protein
LFDLLDVVSLRSLERWWSVMVKCGICGGEAPKQPCITEDGKCDLCGKEVILKEEAKKDKKIVRIVLLVEHLKKPVLCFQVLIFLFI